MDNITVQHRRALAAALSVYESTLSKVSLDTKRHTSLIDNTSFAGIYDFDALVKDYSNKGHPINSNDALFIDDSGRIYFIEFKNRNILDKKDKQIISELRFNLSAKIASSILVLIDKQLIPSCEFARNNITYILVYKPNEKHKGSDRFYNTLEHLQKPDSSTYRLFGLAEKYKNLFFYDVLTYSDEEFNSLFVNRMVPFTLH